MKKIYSDDELFCNNEQKAYSGDAGCVDFLLGGIGTGNVSLGARGNLTTWQIFNQPGQLNRMPYTFFSIWMKQDGGEAVSRVLESKLNPPFNRSQNIPLLILNFGMRKYLFRSVWKRIHHSFRLTRKIQEYRGLI